MALRALLDISDLAGQQRSPLLAACTVPPSVRPWHDSLPPVTDPAVLLLVVLQQRDQKATEP